MRESSRFGRLLASRWFDPGLALLLTAAGLVELFARSDLPQSPPWVLAMVALGALIVVRRTHPVPATCAAAVVFLAMPGADNDGLAAAFAVVSILAYSCGAHAPRRSALPAVGLLAASMQIDAGFADFPNFEIYLGAFIPWWVGSQVATRRRLVAELAERTAQLEAEQDAFARLAVRRERARIARELHDIVAHHLAVIVVQSGAGRMAPAAQGDGVAERFANIRESGEAALAEMARLVDLIEADTHADAGALGNLQVLLDDARAGGVRVGFTPLPAEIELSPEVEEVAYRVVREGLTNAIKHAPGAEVTVRLAVSAEELEVEVRDAGAASPSPLAATGAGLGLTGMRERVESLGGRVEAGPHPDCGWQVCARLPLSARALPPAR
jgi:signal transduction histidine kinase